jgi:hypothetical protein
MPIRDIFEGTDCHRKRVGLNRTCPISKYVRSRTDTSVGILRMMNATAPGTAKRSHNVRRLAHDQLLCAIEAEGNSVRLCCGSGRVAGRSAVPERSGVPQRSTANAALSPTRARTEGTIRRLISGSIVRHPHSAARTPINARRSDSRAGRASDGSHATRPAPTRANFRRPRRQTGTRSPSAGRGRQ